MDWGSRLAITILSLTIFLVGSSTLVTGFGGDGNATFQDRPDCEVYQEGPATNLSCFNEEDDNDHGGSDVSDKACVKPIEPCVDNKVIDRTEGNIWDTDLARTLAKEGDETESESPVSEGILFTGKVIRGQLDDNTFLEEDSSDDTSVTERWIDEARPETENINMSNWSFGHDQTNIINEDQFPEGTEFESGRAVYPPNPLAGDGEKCGDGKENDVDEGTIGPESPDDDAINTDDNSLQEETDCRADYGRIQEKYNIQNTFGDDGLSCDDDDAEADAECSGMSCATGSCGGGGNDDTCTCEGSVNTNNCYQDQTVFHYLSDDEQKIQYETCEDDGTSDSTAEDSDDTTKDLCDTSTPDDCDPDQYGDPTDNHPETDTTTSKTCYRGDERSWNDKGDDVDCDSFNTVDGGASDADTSVDGKSYDWNDEAATYTDFKAYGDPNWDDGSGGSTTYDGSDDGICDNSATSGESDSDSPSDSQEGTGRAWCAFEYTVTVDADGPKGYGDGFVVVENRDSDGKHSDDSSDWSIVATEAHNGEDIVGENIWVATRQYGDGSASGNHDFSNLDEMTENDDIMSCPGDKEVCLKYVDYWSEDDDDWAPTSAGNGYKEIVEATERHALTPDQSYSVCKNINRIARQNGEADGDLVRCDYVREDSSEPGGVKRISPLPEACGDDPGERLIAAEGTEVDEEEMEEYLAYHQECYQYPEDPDDVDNTAPDEDVDAGDYTRGGPGDHATSDELDDEWVSLVQFGDIGKVSSVDTDDGYEDFTGTGDTEIRRGNDPRLYVESGMETNDDVHVKAWIDFDQDQDLSDSDEEFDLGDVSSNGAQTESQISVPGDAELGYTLMRVAVRYDNDPLATKDGSWTYGEAEDYSVRIRKSDENDEEITTGACVLNGKVYPEGSVENVADVPQFRTKFEGFEIGGSSNDKEVCLNIDDSLSENGGAEMGTEVDNLLEWKYPGDRDKGGEWWDVDNWKATEYIRNHDLDSSEYEEYWVSNPDLNASDNTDITGVEDRFTSEGGMALEDDCAATINDERIDCEDRGPNVGTATPVLARFTEGARDDDYNYLESRFEINMPNYHNRVQTGGNTGHEEDQPLSKTVQDVDSDTEWEQGSFEDTEAQNNYLNTSEDRGSAQRDAGVMNGEEVFGKYTSQQFSKQGETLFTNIKVSNEFSGGDHPLVVEYSEDSDFSASTKQEFWLNDTYNVENFTLGASREHEYLRYKVGIGDEEIPSQVAFGVDETYSMNDAHDEVSTEIDEFFDGLGSGSEGSVLGSGCDGSQIGSCPDGQEPRDLSEDEGLTRDTDEILNAANRLSERTYFEGPDETVAEMVGWGSEHDDYSGSDYYDDEDYGWSDDYSKAVIWVQSGVSGRGTCDDLGERGSGTLGQHIIDDDITFYVFGRDLYDHCRDNYEQLAQDTGGEFYEMADNNDNIDFSPALNDIQSDLSRIPREPLVDRVEITSSTPPDPGTGNTQDDEPAQLALEDSTEYLEWHENAEIDPQDDEWAYTPEMSWGIANNGTAWPPGQCWGAPRVQGVDKHKANATYANSYLRGRKVVRDTDMFAEPKADGNWINPDNDSASVIEGGVTCDLTGHDWGYAVQNDTYSGIDCLEGDCSDTGNPSSPGTEGVDSSIPHEIVVDTDDFAWDKDSNPGDKDQDNLRQWKDACGDDRNEYLIREHAAKLEGEYNPNFVGRDKYYACADRPTDCVLDGEVYSEGQIVDVSDVTQESGVQSEDEEICLDRNDELPGGEWWDVDNQEIREELIGEGIVEDPEVFVREGEIEPDKPYKIFWHNGSTGDSVRDTALREAAKSPYSPLNGTGIYGTGIDYWRGYALEDDCDTDVQAGCDDKGTDESLGTHSDSSSDLIYSHFRESKDTVAVKGDDYSTEDTWVVRMYVDGSTDHDSNTGQMGENTDDVSFDSTEWGWPTSGVNNSEIDSKEDTWAIASETYDAVGPTGAVYDTGQCHGKNPPEHSEGWVEKNETIMANSFAKREEVNSDDKDEGNWVDPDTTVRTVSRGGLSCDLNSTDWGIGYDTGEGSDLEVYEGEARTEGYEVQDRHAVAGPITFDQEGNPLGQGQNDLQQHPSACGDDKNEYLIREQRTFRGNEIDPNLEDRENIYVCADRITDCAYNGSVYSEGQVVDISEKSPSHTDPESGDNLTDEEICLDLNKKTPGGEWYDKDQDLTVQNRIIGLEDTFDVSEGTNGFGDSFTLKGEVVDSTGGELDINNRRISVDSNGEFSDSINLIGGTDQRIEYHKDGEIKAKKRIRLPPESSATLEDIVISTNLAYEGWDVWNNIEHYKDLDFDRNNRSFSYNGTDWRSQSEQYERTELEYFTSTEENVGGPAPTENVRGKETRYYTPEGYATEDDCGPLLRQSDTGPCSDVGGGTQNSEWFSAGNFSLGGVPP